MAKPLRDPNQLAKLIVDVATGETEDAVSESKRPPSRKRNIWSPDEIVLLAN